MSMQNRQWTTLHAAVHIFVTHAAWLAPFEASCVVCTSSFGITACSGSLLCCMHSYSVVMTTTNWRQRVCYMPVKSSACSLSKGSVCVRGRQSLILCSKKSYKKYLKVSNLLGKLISLEITCTFALWSNLPDNTVCLGSLCSYKIWLSPCKKQSY